MIHWIPFFVRLSMSGQSSLRRPPQSPNGELRPNGIGSGKAIYISAHSQCGQDTQNRGKAGAGFTELQLSNRGAVHPHPFSQVRLCHTSSDSSHTEALTQRFNLPRMMQVNGGNSLRHVGLKHHLAGY